MSNPPTGGGSHKHAGGKKHHGGRGKKHPRKHHPQHRHAGHHGQHTAKHTPPHSTGSPVSIGRQYGASSDGTCVFDAINVSAGHAIAKASESWVTIPDALSLCAVSFAPVSLILPGVIIGVDTWFGPHAQAVTHGHCPCWDICSCCCWCGIGFNHGCVIEEAWEAQWL